MLQISVYRAVIHQRVTARFGYFDEQLDEMAFGSTGLAFAWNDSKLRKKFSALY